MRHRSNGFSLVELLVVVAILALFAIVGMVVYTKYIDSVKDQRVLAEAQQIQKNIELDALRATHASPNDTCKVVLDGFVEKLYAQNKSNPFSGAFLVQTAVANSTLPRGGIYIACAVPNAKVADPDFYVQTCACTESDCLLATPSANQTLSSQECYEL